jgi:hypothetical protein
MPLPTRFHHGTPVDPQRKRCPVCHEPVYSLAGIHPQCAVKLIDDAPPTPPSTAVDAHAEPVLAESLTKKSKANSFKTPPVKS